MLKILPYRSCDCLALTRLFYDTVHSICAQDYTAAQLDAWANGVPDLSAWDKSLLAHFSFVAWLDGQIVGFGDISHIGYLDRLYVHRDFQRRGVASALCGRLEAFCTGKITTHASVTARGFFQQRGYQVVRAQQVERAGEWLRNYVMEKTR